MNLTENNSEVLEKRFPGTLKKCLQADTELKLEISSAQDGSPVFSLKDKDGRNIIFDSQLDPRKEARDLLGAQNFNETTVVFVFGLGFGYYLEELCKRFSGMIFVIEPSAEILRSALQEVDLTGVLAHENVFLLTDDATISTVMLLYSNLQKNGFDRLLFLVHPGYGFFSHYYSGLKKKLSEGLPKNTEANTKETILTIIKSYVKLYKESGFSDLRSFNHVRLIASFFSMHEDSVQMLFDNALFLFNKQQYPLALEAFNIFWGEDSMRLNNRFFEDKDIVSKSADCYSTIAKASCGMVIPSRNRLHAGKKKLTIGHLTAIFIDDTHSPTRLLKTFVRHHNRDKFNLCLYSSELCATRPGRNYFVGISSASSSERGPGFMNYLKQNDIPCYLAPTSGTHLDSAAELYNQIVKDQIDILFFHSSMFSTIDFLVSSWQAAPVQVNVNIGTFMFSDKLDAVTYFVPSALAKEQEFWAQSNIQTKLMPQGADFFDRIETAHRANRADYGVQEKTVVLISVGNHLDTRISRQCLELISVFLKRDDCAWLVIGDGDFSSQCTYLEQQGLLNKVKFLGAQRDIFCFYKMADIYVNEFPKGGGMSVLEAMSVGLPVVALNAGTQHLENCGANYVGQEYSLEKSEDYADFLGRLIRDENLRRQVGSEMRLRYENEFSPLKMVRAFEDLAVEIYKGKNERNRE